MNNRIFPMIAAFFVVIGLLSSTVFIVDQRKYAAVFAFGELVRVIEEPGLQFKLPPPFQSVQFFERRILTIDTPDAERFITAEKKNLLVDSYVKWRIVEPRRFFISFRGDERLAQDRLNQLVKSALNEEFTKRTVRELISEQREQVMQNIRKKVAEEAADIGIEIVDVRLKRIDLLAEISESVFRRMEAERKRVANELRSTGAAESEKIRADAERQRDIILSRAYRDAQKIKGQGDAKATALYGEAFNRDPQFAQFYRSLEAYRSSFKTKQDLMVMDPNSEFLKFMKSSRPQGAPSIPAAK
ncbi:MAG: protease modulator HflC [Polynucleobacter victoriensis]|jgi:modulator of FtsH protease HflC|uniref:Protein HflC n=1 Tax=Polynucleobacter victoriensis TaxID=2049319 RepID=A0A212T167_9BURK|nr:protease modulator HflC [Polynucleobacter victoriensis]SNC59581.1 membrane protease subunit HflC [Polynucleobacter victoriensis]